jgi:hypothetical protein
MPPRWFSQCLHPNGDLPQTSTQNLPPTQILSTITEGSSHLTFSDIPEVELLHPVNNASTAAAGLSQNVGGTLHQSPPRTPSPIQVIQGNTVPVKIPVEDWEDVAFEDEAAEDEELGRVQ